MLIDLQHAVGGFLHGVFVSQFDGWVVLGFIAQLMFTARFLVQWVESERQGRSVIPITFWFFSIAGGVLLLAYAIYRRDPVFILGQAFGVMVYSRNLYLVLTKGKQQEEQVSESPPKPKRAAARRTSAEP